MGQKQKHRNWFWFEILAAHKQGLKGLQVFSYGKWFGNAITLSIVALFFVFHIPKKNKRFELLQRKVCGTRFRPLQFGKQTISNVKTM